jgi:hypothetical protein
MPPREISYTRVIRDKQQPDGLESDSTLGSAWRLCGS